MERAGIESTEIFRKTKEICDRLIEKEIGFSSYDEERKGRTPPTLRFFVRRKDKIKSGEEGDVEDAQEESQPLRDPQTGIDYDSGTQSDIRFDVKTWFMKELTQEEIESIDSDEVKALHEEALREVKEKPSATKSVLPYKTLSLMEKKWEERE
jgi:hypothetical protein